MSGRQWTATEDMAVRELYPIHGMAWARWPEVLPGRTAKAVAERASRLGVTGALPADGTRRPRAAEHPRIAEIIGLLGEGVPPSAIDSRLGLRPDTARKAISKRWRITRGKDSRS